MYKSSTFIDHGYIEQLSSLYSVEEAKQKAASIMVHIFGIRVYGYHLHSTRKMELCLRAGLPWLLWRKLNH